MDSSIETSVYVTFTLRLESGKSLVMNGLTEAEADQIAEGLKALADPEVCNLKKFYDETTLLGLIQAQDKSIAKLQERLNKFEPQKKWYQFSNPRKG